MSIFSNLLDYNYEPPRIKEPTDPTATISDKQFRNYVRRADAEDFMYGNPDKGIVGFDTKLE